MISNLRIAACWAMAAGLVEALIQTIRKQYLPLLDLGPHYVWMIPMALLAVFVPVALSTPVLSRVLRKIDAQTLTTFFVALPSYFGLIILAPIHHVAALVLALGAASQTAHLAQKHAESYSTLLRRTAPVLAALILGIGLGMPLTTAFAANRRLASLPEAPANVPNIVFITLDTVRAANMSVYGYERKTTPHLEELASSGVVFTNALSTASWTLPSHASMFTGRWYHELKLGYFVPLDNEHPTLAEALSAQGYSTAGFVANLGYCGSATGLARGFNHYEDYPLTFGQIASSATLTRTVADNFRLRRLIQNDQHLNRKTADMLNRDVLAWIDRQTRPFFIFVNYFDAHEPYLPPAPFDTRFGPGRRHGKHSPLHHWLYNPAVEHTGMDSATVQEELDAYDGAIAYLDDRLHELFQELRARNLLDNTLVIITSDHGEEFGEHEVFEHSYSLYRPSVHVPLILLFPGRFAEGTRVDTPVSLRDLPATIMHLAGIEPGVEFPGDSLARHWTAGTELIESPLRSDLQYAPGQPDWFPVSKGDMHSVLFDGKRYIRSGDGAEELYDFAADKWEKHNLAADPGYEAVLARFRAMVAAESLH